MRETIFSVIGPVMIGPSSSHTAGVARLGKISRHILDREPEYAEIYFFHSLAETLRGHGSDRAVIGGILGFDSADEKLPESLELAGERGLEFTLKKGEERGAHPNSLLIKLESSGETVEVFGSSRGGGNILVEKINGFDVSLEGRYNALWILHLDRPGLVAEIASLLAAGGINIAFMRLQRSQPRGMASLVVECDQHPGERIQEDISRIKFVESCRIIPPVR